jgi:hypothetical protein
VKAGGVGFVCKIDMGHELTRAVGAANRREVYLSRGALGVGGVNCRTAVVSRVA